MKSSEMAQALAIAFSAWPNFQITEPMAKLWCSSFEGTSKAAFWKALQSTLKTHRGNFPPTIGQVTETLEQFRTLNEPTEGELWQVVMSAISRFGYMQPALAREYIREHGGEKLVQTVRALGWQNVCNWQIADEPANRAHFWRVFQSFKNRETFVAKTESVTGSQPERISGIANKILEHLEGKNGTDR